MPQHSTTPTLHPSVALYGEKRETATRWAEELLREIRNQSAKLRLLCNGALMPAEAMGSLESARDEIVRLMR